MAQKKTKTKSRSRAKPKVVSSKGSRLQRLVAFLRKKPVLLLVLILSGAMGVYLLVDSFALGQDEVLLPDDPARGLVYNGKKVKTKGPCAGGFDITTQDEEKKFGKDKRHCAHLDPTPPGVDIRERVKKVDQSLAAIAAHDEKYKPAASDDTSGYEQPAIEVATIGEWSMEGLGGRDWPCAGDGKNGARIELVYVYPAGGTNRLSDLRGGFNGIARRINQIYYASGSESGNAHQIRFVTNNGDPGCSLKISAEGIRGDELDNTSFIRARLAERGYKGVPLPVNYDSDPEPDYTDYVDRKYLIWVDKRIENSNGALLLCGLGGMTPDDSASQQNINNHSISYAFAWKGCWNYAEPHELTHMLGGVQSSAPRGTAGHHCYDERDVMCYDDDGSGPVTMRRVCTRNIDWWRLDCNHNDFYRGNDPASGYLSNHWNTANNRFLTR